MMATEDARADDQGIIEQGPEEESGALFDSDEFRMFCYKVLPCAKRAAHEWTTCPWAHPGERARRRDPRVYSYLAIPCPDTKEGKECPRGDDCPNCHSLFEYWLHPSRYRTQLCRNNDGSHCKRQICFFAHSIEELRVPDHSHLNIPEEMKQQSSNTDNTSATVAANISGSDAPKQACNSSPSTSPKAGQSSSAHKVRKDHRHSGAGKTATKATGGSSTIGELTTSGSLQGSLKLSAQSSSPSGTVNCVMRQPSGQLQLPSAEQLGAMLVSPANGETLRRSVSLDVAGPAASRQQTLAGPPVAGSSALFSSGMMADPEVGEPAQSPQALAVMQQQQALLMQMQKEQYEASLGAAALAYEQQQNLGQLLMAQQQQQQAATWASSHAYANGPTCSSGEYASPPVSPTASSMLSSGMPDDTCSSAFTSLGSNISYVSAYGGSMRPGMAWQPQLPRTLSGPPVCSSHTAYAQSPALRYQSMDSAVASAAAAAAQMPASAADYAAVRMQMELMRSPQGQAMVAAAASVGAPMYAGMAPSPQQQVQQQVYMQQQQQRKAAVPEQQLNLADVADLVDSVNRGEMGESGSQVLTGVIGLLMQQLQQQQLSA